jgi:hypothetical protein
MAEQRPKRRLGGSARGDLPELLGHPVDALLAGTAR